MGKLTSEVFNESCCDGGACSTAESAQNCGCDLGANHKCDRHKDQYIKDLVHWYLKRFSCADMDIDTLNAHKELYAWSKS